MCNIAKIDSLKFAHSSRSVTRISLAECSVECTEFQDFGKLTFPYLFVFPLTYRSACKRPLSSAPVFASICCHSWTSRLNGAPLLLPLNATTSIVDGRRSDRTVCDDNVESVHTGRTLIDFHCMMVINIFSQVMFCAHFAQPHQLLLETNQTARPTRSFVLIF